MSISQQDKLKIINKTIENLQENIKQNHLLYLQDKITCLKYSKVKASLKKQIISLENQKITINNAIKQENKSKQNQKLRRIK